VALYAIGDLHGCARTLDALALALAARFGALAPDDTVVFLGDYVDRGPDSPGTLDRMLEWDARATEGTGPACVFLRGNHDQMMLDHADGTGDDDLWWINGGRGTLAQYARPPYGGAVPDAHLDFLRRTRLAHVEGGFAFVHAGLHPARSVADNLARMDPQVLLWTRRHWAEPLDLWEMPVVCGHTPFAEPVNHERVIGLDTGAVFYDRPNLGHLTAVRLPERVFVSVPYAG
jgi:serine/threonine protein phosphatase 1